MTLKKNGRYFFQPKKKKKKFQDLFGWRGEKVGGQKIVRGWKTGRVEKILISFFFMHISLLKNDAQLKPKK